MKRLCHHQLSKHEALLSDCLANDSSDGGHDNAGEGSSRDLMFGKKQVSEITQEPSLGLTMAAGYSKKYQIK